MSEKRKYFQLWKDMSGLRHAKDEELLGFRPVWVQGLQISLYGELDFLQDFFKSKDNLLL